VVTGPLWTLCVWGRRPGLALVGLVALIAALAVTGAALWLVRQPAAGQSAVVRGVGITPGSPYPLTSVRRTHNASTPMHLLLPIG